MPIGSIAYILVINSSFFAKINEFVPRLEDLDTIRDKWPLLMDNCAETKERQRNLETLLKEMKKEICACVVIFCSHS